VSNGHSRMTIDSRDVRVCVWLRSDSAQAGSRRPASAFVLVILGPFADSCDASPDVSRDSQGE